MREGPEHQSSFCLQTSYDNPLSEGDGEPSFDGIVIVVEADAVVADIAGETRERISCDGESWEGAGTGSPSPFDVVVAIVVGTDAVVVARTPSSTSSSSSGAGVT